MKLIGLLDCNNFFVSCERLFRPDLKNVPTVVLSGNDGCVVARSNEIKAMGVPMGVPFFQVRKELEKAGTAVFSSNFPLYRDISSRVMEVLKVQVDTYEQYSVDEAFFEIDSDGVEERIKEIKRVVEQYVGVPVSIGVGKTKTIAKCASEVGKKDPFYAGTAVLVDEAWRSHASTLGINEIWGIGVKTATKLRNHEILTVEDYLNIDKARLDKLFGISGLRMHSELSEHSIYKVGGDKTLQKSIMSTRSFKSTTNDIAVLKDSVAYHVGHIAEELRSQGACTSVIRVLIHPSRHGDWVLRGGSLEAVLDTHTDDTMVLLKEAFKLLESLHERDVPYKKAGVVVSSIRLKGNVQSSLFEESTDQSEGNVMSAIDELNSRFGPGTVTLGRVNLNTKWKGSKEFVSNRYTTDWGDIPSVRA